MTDPTVVLVSVGADSAVLIDEIEKKGLRVVSCPFAEAEEAIEREKPLLVVLHGARGAVELSTMLEDADDPPQVAVVAARAELGTLMGLNRDIVVSLLATELTEKTVAVRLEAVARQRAKALGLTLNLAARRMSLGPRPNLSRPAPRPGAESKPPQVVLDAPTPDLQGRAKAPAPPALESPGPPRVMSSPGLPKARSSRGMGPPESRGRPHRVSSGTAIGLPSPGRPDPSPASSARATPATPSEAESSVLSESILLSDVPAPPPRSAQAAGAPPPPRAAPPRPGAPSPEAPALPAPRAQVPESIDSDAPTAVISLSPSVIESLGPKDGGEAEIPIAPGAPPVPRFEPSDLLQESGLDESVGPDLRAALSMERPPLSLDSPLGTPPKASEPELPSAPLLPRVSAGISEAGPDVLDRLAPLAEAATLPPGLDSPGEQLTGGSPTSSDEDDLALPLLRPSRPPDDDFSSGMLTEVTMPAIPGSLAAEALAEARLRSEPNHPIPEPPPESTDPELDRATVTGAAPASLAMNPPAPFSSGRQPAVSAAPTKFEREDLDRAAPPRRTGATLIALCAVLAAIGGAAAYVKWGVPKVPQLTSSKEPSAQVPAANPLPSADPADARTDYGDPDAPTPEPAPADTPAPPEPSGEAPTEDVPPPEPLAVPPDEGEPAPSEPAPASPSAPASIEPAVLLDNPFLTPDAQLAGCEELAPGARPTTGDPVTEASGHWSAARKNIVKGDIEGASRAMCFAAAINPQSPAVEGLARLYTLAHSPAQALVWIEKAIQLAPTNRELINLRGDAKSQLGQQDEATMDWLEAMGIAAGETKRRVNQAAEYANIARTEKGRSDLAKAEQFFRRALGFEETNLVALTGLAEVMLARQLYDQAGTFAVRALAVFEPVPEAYLVLGDVALAKNDPARARGSFERALAIRPDFWPAKKRLRELAK